MALEGELHGGSIIWHVVLDLQLVLEQLPQESLRREAVDQVRQVRRRARVRCGVRVRDRLLLEAPDRVLDKGSIAHIVYHELRPYVLHVLENEHLRLLVRLANCCVCPARHPPLRDRRCAGVVRGHDVADIKSDLGLRFRCVLPPRLEPARVRGGVWGSTRPPH